MAKITFIKQNGKKIEVEGKNGLSVMEVAIANGIEIEAACEGSMACATCHLICDSEWYDKIPHPSEEEKDMLDLAFNVTDTSRLSCQVRINDSLDGIIFSVPEE